MFTKIAFGLVVLCLLAAVASGFGHRLQLWGYAAGFKILTGAVAGAGVGILLALIGAQLAWRSGEHANLAWSVAALVVGLVVIVPPLLQVRATRQLPYIHDITTDTENPPAFVAMLKERASAPNSAEYGGAEIARLQRQAYPDVQPLILRTQPRDAFVAALETASTLGWTIVESDPQVGRIEAWDRTFWYGFIDDVVIRIAPAAHGGSRVDVRSVSRVGKSDIGANARRVRNFLARLSERLNAKE